MTDNVDDFLAHYGVKGMKWGVTKAKYKSMSKADRKAQKTKAIESARTRIGSGENRQKYLKGKANVSLAKAQLKKAKADRSPAEVIAKRKAGLEASKAVLKKIKTQNVADNQTAGSAKNGKEFASILLLGGLGQQINYQRDVDRLLLSR